MLVALMAYDKDGALEVRKANRDAHVAYLKSNNVVKQAGPFLDDAGEMCGSLIILDVANIEIARKWAENDPYAIAGLFREVSLIPWNRVIG
ncbi:MAG: hypothetical protein ACI9PU_001655 [Ascidiaceihabitans sp.]|jgi:uncharacterized protein YciI|tara:strand:+ start:5501 stop:5773 length:273 start_codon:yes stop_codon:yes gene_type:complete